MSFSTRLLTALCAISTPLAAQDLPPLAPCDGTYQVEMGPVVMNSSGGTVPGRGAENMGQAIIETTACGREFSLTLQGQLRFLQTVMDERTYVADVPGGDGVQRTMTVTLDFPGTLTGEMKAQDPQLTVTRTLIISPIDVTMPDLEGCFDNPPEALPDRGMGPGEGPLQDAMAKRGLTPPTDFGFGDYIQGDGSSDSLSYSASVKLSETGNLLPNLEDRGSLQELMCGGTEYEPPKYILDVKINEVEGSTFIFIRIIEIETSRIVEQREAVIDSVNPSDIGDGINDAWDQLDWQTGSMTNGEAG